MIAPSILAPSILAPSILAWAVEALVASALLMAAVLLARAPVRRAFGPQVAYALWALPLLRLLLPPLPADWREQAAMPISAAGEAMTVLILPADLPTEVAAGFPWAAVALAGWALGALAFFAFQLARHRRFCAALLRDARLVRQVEGVRVIESAAATGPLAFGLHRRFVAFPADFAERYDAAERELALAHELGHHRARDLAANWGALVVLALHWFNPLAWRAFRAFRCDQELANDARVLAGRSRTDAHVYACAILKAAHGGHVSAACHLHTIADLKGRLRMLTRTNPSRRRVAAGSTAVVGLVAAGLCLTASGTRAAAAVSTRIGDAVGVDLAAQATPPAPPVPPAAPPAPAAPATPVAPATAVKRVVVVKDGKAQTYTGAEAEVVAAAHQPPVPPAPPVKPPLPDMKATTLTRDGQIFQVFTGPVTGRRFTMVAPPTILDRTCADGPDGGPQQFFLSREEKGRRVTIFCRNRIDKVTKEAMLTATLAPRNERATAFASIRTARASIAADRNLSDAQRRAALAGLDQAQAELHSSRD